MQPQLADKACATCHAMHKKCDKKIPCTRCAKAHRECVYTNISRRGPKPLTYPYPQFAQKTPPSLTTGFDTITLHSNELLFNAMHYVHNEMFGIENKYRPVDDELALTNALKALVLIRYDTVSAIECFERARMIVMPKFDMMFKSIALVACSLFLGLFCIITNNYERCKFFLDTVKSYLEHNSTSDPNIDIIRTRYQDITGDLEIDANMDLMVAETQQINSISSEHQRVKKAKEWAESSSLPALEFARFLMNMRLQGVHAKQCFRNGLYHQATQAADFIAHNTFSPKFASDLVSLGQVVKCAANIHVHSWCMSTDEEIKSNAITCLKFELDALLLIQNKNRIVGPRLEDTVQKVSYMLRSSQERIALNQLVNWLRIEPVEWNQEERESETIDQFFQDFM